MTESDFLDPDKLGKFLRLDNAVVTLLLVLVSWAVYKLLLRKVSTERHRLLGSSFRNLFGHTAFAGALYCLYQASQIASVQIVEVRRLLQIFAVFVLCYGILIVVKTCRILVFEYLFLGHMSVPVPLLLVNLFTFLVALSLGVFVFAELFGIRLTPLLATSAVLSLVLGLALQDTLGNLFAGISLQFDKSYEIGDWIEVSSGGQKMVGQIKEITWRATLLAGFFDELITIPNRSMAQSQIYNYASRFNPVIRVLIFRVPYGTNIDVAKGILLKVAESDSGVSHEPAPTVLLSEAHENGVSLKLVYYIQDFGKQYLIADRLIEGALRQFAGEGIEIASPRIHVRS